MSSNKKPTNFHKSKSYLKKKKSTKSNDKESDQSKNRTYQSLDPDQIRQLLNEDNTYVDFKIPYYGWKLFFSDEDYKDDSDTVKKVQAVENFIRTHQRLFLPFTIENLENCSVFSVDIRDLYSDSNFLNEWPDFNTNISEDPSRTLNCFKLAIHQQILNTIPKETLTPIDIISNVSTVRLKILNYLPIVPLQDIKANYYGKLISIRGCVIRVGRVKHLAQWILFSCCQCNLQQLKKLPLGVYKVPKKCSQCGVSKFRANLDSPLVKSTSFQTIKIQEISNNDQNSKGGIPRMLDVEIIDDLVNTCLPGDDIVLTGIIKGTNDGSRNKISFSLYMEAITIINSKQKLQNESITDNEMRIKDYMAIKEVYNMPNIFAHLVHSLCPTIYGHQLVKAGLLLSLFGGNMERSEIRDNIHVLVIGDPGLGKSQMLQACTRVSAKAVYVCGNSSTSSGLTITVAKEKQSNNFALEPGALVLTDRGCCCIDEFDKMSKQHAVLLEAMEQQCVSVAKSGIVCSLPTRTSILAAANPIHGRFNRTKTMIQNLNMNAPLLSRFDLIFLLLDEPNQIIDDLLSKHVMSMHSGLHLNEDKSRQSSTNIPDIDSNLSLRDKLACFMTDNANIIPQAILRKYIAYAKQYVKPTISEKAAKVLQNYYLDQRSKINRFEDLSVCNRQLEAMIRLTEARAKSELRTEATETDALDVIEILQHTYESKTIKYDFPSSKNITSGKVKKFVSILQAETSSDSSKRFTMRRLEEIASSNNIIVDNFSEFVLKLNQNGVLLKAGNNTFKFIS
ncbi:DNA helicase MCM8 [Ceratina calcarata]|uniref:DNA helicase MCM8 n=1 Tax=Ceratina calcarata TaxID=156304 RepID=A0AAJ7JFM3_9HYME|nr:DNA helicase MCM8 [Ceratina calcarata]